MSSEYKKYLELTIDCFKQLKTKGVKSFCIESSTLEALSKPVLRRVILEQPMSNVSSNIGINSNSEPETMSNELNFNQNILKPELTPEQKIEALNKLREKVLQCAKCQYLVSFRKNVVFGVGNSDAKLMFVGEAPGADEDLQGEPFVGRAGQLLTKIISAMGLSRKDVYIANILKCRPDTSSPTGNRTPTVDEMRICIPYLYEQIDIIRPRVIVALGATAVEGLLGEKLAITKVRGLWREFCGIPLMPTYHPAYLLRNQSIAAKREVWYDMLKVMEKLGMPISEKQRNYFSKSSNKL